MGVAKVFQSGNSQAVRLPKEFRFNSAEIDVFRRGDEVVLRDKPRTMERAFDLLASLAEDLADTRRKRVRRDTLPQKRKGL